jgi:hypothetical protein
VPIINLRVHLDNAALDLVSVEMLAMKLTVVKVVSLSMELAMEL